MATNYKQSVIKGYIALKKCTNLQNLWHPLNWITQRCCGKVRRLEIGNEPSGLKKNPSRFSGGKNEIQKICLSSVNFVSNWIKKIIYETYDSFRIYVCCQARWKSYSLLVFISKIGSFDIISQQRVTFLMCCLVISPTPTRDLFRKYNILIGSKYCIF